MSDLRRSLALDLSLLRVKDLPLAGRMRLLQQKLPAAVSIARHQPYRVRLGDGTSFTVSSLIDLGSLQASVTDLYDELVLPRVLEGADYVVDVGANIGQWTTAVKLFSPETEVLAVEPDPEVFERLRQNVGGLPGVTCRCTAAGATRSSGVLYRHELSVMSSLHPEGERYADSNKVEVAVDTIDNLVGGRPVDVLKIDVEGAELDALKGAGRTLERARYLLVELSLARRAAGSAIDTLAYLNSRVPGARILKLGRGLGDRDRPTSQDAVIELHPNG